MFFLIYMFFKMLSNISHVFFFFQDFVCFSFFLTILKRSGDSFILDV